jgi:hypothetical protein
VRIASILVFVCLAAAACGGAGGTGSSANPVTAKVTARSLRGALLTAAQLPATPNAFAGGPVSAGSIPDDPDPRGPCGTKLPQPSLRSGAVAQFRSPEPAAVFEWISRTPPGEATAYLAGVAADIRPGCAAFKSATPYGHPQLNVFVRATALPPLGDQRVAATMHLRLLAPGERAAYVTEILIREGDYMTALIVSGLRPQPPRFLRAVAVSAAADLSRLLRPASPA